LILKLERENFDPDSENQGQLYCYAISAKRYALFNLKKRHEPVLRKWSEHGLISSIPSIPTMKIAIGFVSFGSRWFEMHSG
jgi:hypothetical protein